LSPLHDIIADEIRRLGPISIARFMELCLYHPDHGYYETDGRAIGRSGDFFTSVSVGSLFGELLGWRFAQWLRENPSEPCQIVEAGAHDGQLALDLLGFLEKSRPDVFERLEFLIIEPSESRRSRQRERLASYAKTLRWTTGWNETGAPEINGVIYSNELLDAFPIDQFGWDKAGQTWFRFGVDLSNNGFTRTRMHTTEFQPEAPPELLAALPDGFTVERANAATNWWRQAANALNSGRLLAIDYGFAEPEPFSPARPHGTLRAYRDHQLSDKIFNHVGEQDLTSHVSFPAFIEAGQSCGLIASSRPVVSQSKFLIETLSLIQKEPASFPNWTPKRLRQFQTLTHPDHLGEKFKVLIQRRE
jgi:SAM-dependent MidA family methyltransferase